MLPNLTELCKIIKIMVVVGRCLTTAANNGGGGQVLDNGRFLAFVMRVLDERAETSREFTPLADVARARGGAGATGDVRHPENHTVYHKAVTGAGLLDFWVGKRCVASREAGVEAARQMFATGMLHNVLEDEEDQDFEDSASEVYVFEEDIHHEAHEVAVEHYAASGAHTLT